MFKTIPRNMFGAVQAKLFPRFFALTTGCNVALIVTLLLSTPGTVNWPALRPLLVASVASVLNWQVFEPLCTGLMFSRWRLEAKPSKSEADAAEISSLYKQFGTWHVVSSMMNLVVFICSVAHGWCVLAPAGSWDVLRSAC